MTTHPLVGVHHNINIDAYHSSAGISKSGLDKINQSPYHYWSHYLDPQRPPEEPRTSASEMAGTLLHAALLEPDEFDKRYAVGPDVARSTKVWKEFEEGARAQGKAAIKPEQYTAAKRQADACRALPEVRDALSKGHAEVSAYWRDPETGVLCRCRPDWVTPVGTRQVIHLDAKTYSNASPDEFRRQVARMAYHRQDAWYWDGYQHASGDEVVAFLFVAVELEWPYAASTVMLDDAAREQGRRENRRLLDTYARCLRDNQWPAFPGGPHPVSLPAWALDKE